MSIAAQLRPAIQRRGVQIATRAGGYVTARLAVTTPRKTGQLQRSRRTKITAGPNLVQYEIAFTAKQAGITNAGPKAHTIRGKPTLRFFWPKVGRVVYFRSVRWKPGPGVAKNKRWFSKEVTPAKWRQALNQAARL